MKTIVGLGNPGIKYQKNRHNAGFIALDYIRENYPQFADSQPSLNQKLESTIVEAEKIPGNGNNKILLVYPQNFMNDSGRAVKKILDFYKLSVADILVIHDEIDLPIGVFKFTESSGDAGHNGVKSVIEALGTQNFKRIRVGVESRTDRGQMPTEAFVLQNFTEEELKKLPLKEIAAKAMTL